MKRVAALIFVWLVAFSLDTGIPAGTGSPGIPVQAASADKTAQPGNTENLLFLGDSLLYNPEHESGIFSRNGHQVLAGIGSTLPQFFGVTRKEVTVGMKGSQVTGTLKGRNFNGIAILMGTNDLAGKSALAVFDDYEKLLKELRHFTSKPIYVMRVFPVNEHYSRRYGDYVEKNNSVRVLNGKLNQYCEKTKGVYYIDATDGFIYPNGLFQNDYGDGLHMHPKFYAMFYDNIIEAIEKTRPDQVKADPEYYDESKLEQHWAYPAIRYTQETGLFSGYPDGSFHPNVKISRSMFVTVLGRAAGISEDSDTGEIPFVDILPNDYARPYIAWAADRGIVQGTDADKDLFNPDGLITREQMAMILDRFIAEETKSLENLPLTEITYEDAGQMTPNAVESIARCEALDLMKGDQHHNFRPKENATRADAAMILLRANYLRWMDSFCTTWTQAD